MPTNQAQVLAAVRTGISLATDPDEKRLLRTMRRQWRDPSVPQSEVDELQDAFDFIRGAPSTWTKSDWNLAIATIIPALGTLPWTAAGRTPDVRDFRNVLRDIIDGVAPADPWLRTEAENIARTTMCDEDAQQVRQPYRRQTDPCVVAADAALLVLADPENQTLEALALAQQACDRWRELSQ